MRALVLLLLAVLALPARAEVAPEVLARLNLALADGVAIPAYQLYAEEAAGLPPALDDLCSGRAADPAASREALRAMALAWQRAAPISLGPATEGFGRARVHWWPDPRGTGARQLRRLLVEADEAALQPEAVAEASVAVKGLSALAWLVVERDLAEDDFACRYAHAVARYQARLAQDLVEGWTGEDGFRAELAAAADGGSAAFYGPKDAAQAWLESLSGTLDVIVADKLEAPLGATLDAAKGRRAELARLELALPSIEANLETVRMMLAVPRGFADALRQAGANALGTGLIDLADEAQQQARAVPLPLAEAVGEPATREAVVALLETVRRLRLLVGGPLADELGLVRGFNARDGD